MTPNIKADIESALNHIQVAREDVLLSPNAAGLHLSLAASRLREILKQIEAASKEPA